MPGGSIPVSLATSTATLHSTHAPAGRQGHTDLTHTMAASAPPIRTSLFYGHSLPPPVARRGSSEGEGVAVRGDRLPVAREGEGGEGREEPTIQ